MTIAHDHALDHAPSRTPSERRPSSPTVRLRGVSAGYGVFLVALLLGPRTDLFRPRPTLAERAG